MKKSSHLGKRFSSPRDIHISRRNNMKNLWSRHMAMLANDVRYFGSPVKIASFRAPPGPSPMIGSMLNNASKHKQSLAIGQEIR